MNKESLLRTIKALYLHFLGLLFVFGCATNIKDTHRTDDTIQLTPKESVSCSECFPVESLPSHLQHKAIDALIRLFDSEALYTGVRGIKPISEVDSNWLFPQKSKFTETDVTELETIVSTWRCTSILEAALERYYSDKTPPSTSTIVFFMRKDLVAEVLDRFDFKLGADGKSFVKTPYSSQLMHWIFHGSNKQKALAHRIFGTLYGYPEYAIQHFLQPFTQVSKAAELSDLFSVQTFDKSASLYTWAVPKGHVKNSADEFIESRVYPILQYYSDIRSKMKGKSPIESLNLLRSWFDNGKGQCSPAFAEQKLETNKAN